MSAVPGQAGNSNTEGMMRDLLYLPENKMRALVPQYARRG